MRLLKRGYRYLGICLGAAGLMLAACSTFNADPWSWLDDPSQQNWRTIMVRGPQGGFVFSIPDRSDPGKEQVRSWPEQAPGEPDQPIDVPEDAVTRSTYRAASFVWEFYWDGYYRKGRHDFDLDIWITDRGPDAGLSAASVEARVQSRLEHYERVYSGPDQARMREYFLERYRVEPYESRQSLVWIVENQPQLEASHRVYRLPISDRHEIRFSFFVRQDRHGGPPDPEWMERRWELARRIVDTFRFVPVPN